MIEDKLVELNIELQPQSTSVHPIIHTKQYGNLLFVSGHGTKIHGKLGRELKVEDGYAASREACINCLSAIKDSIGCLDNVKSILKVFGMVNSTPDFIRQPDVMDGASSLLISLFGEEIGSHTRSAVGMASLPNGIAVEIEMIVAIK